MPKPCATSQSLKRMAEVNGFTVDDHGMDGRWRIRKAGTRGVVATVDTEDAAKEYIRTIANTNVADLSGGVPIASSMNLASGSPLPAQSQMTLNKKIRNVVQTAQIGPLTWVTPMEKISQAYQNLKGLPAFDVVFNLPRQAKLLVNRELAFVTRPFLKNKKGGDATFNDAIHDVGMMVGDAELDSTQRKLVTLYHEAYTKNELAVPGVMLEEGLDDIHVGFADMFSRLGTAEDLPTYFRLNAMVDDFMINKQDFVDHKLPGIENAIRDGKLPTEIMPLIQRFKDLAGDEENLEAVIRGLGLTEDEIKTMVNLRVAMMVDVPEGLRTYVPSSNLQAPLNIPAIFRYATAPELEVGFANGREQFVAKRGMKPEAVKIAQERQRILREAFDLHGLNADKTLGAQLPVFRQFIDSGIFPGRQYGETSKGVIGQYAKVLEGFQEGSDVLSRRVLSGHLNPYELDPAVTLNKHVQNVFLRQHFDPVVAPGSKVREVLKKIRSEDPRVAEIHENYLAELEGRQDEQFKNATAVLRTVARVMGKPMDDRLVERITQTLVRTASQATIPLRPALVVRNYLQTAFFTAPVVGPEAWIHGMKMASGAGEGSILVNMRNALEQAIKAGAVDPNVLPIHAFGDSGTNASGSFVARFSPTIAKGKMKLDDLFDAGFSYYRHGDDWGRTVAFFAGKKRANDAISKFMHSGRQAADYDRLIVNAKVKHFDETIEQGFRDLISRGEYDQAENLVGVKLADKAHLLYENATHPSGWGGVAGRLFGQFGTFPVQYASYLLETSTRLAQRGSLKDLAEFGAIHSALNMGVIYAGSEFLEADLSSWGTFGSIFYGGGPYADIAFNAVALWRGSDAEKRLAKRNLGFALPSLENPGSPFVPGSYMISDLVRAADQDDPMSVILRGIGIRPLERGGFDPADVGPLGWTREIVGF